MAQAGGVHSSIARAFDQVKSSMATNDVLGSISDYTHLDVVCKFLIEKQLRTLHLDLFIGVGPNKQPFIVAETNGAVIKSYSKDAAVR